MKFIIYIITLIIVVICFSINSYSIVSDRIKAIVNEEVITISEIENIVTPQKELLSKKYKGADFDQKLNEMKMAILNSLIEKKIQIHEAKNKGIFVSQEDMNTAIDDIKKKNNFPDDAALKNALESENIKYDEYLSDLRDQLTLIKLLNKDVWKDIFIDEGEIRIYYENNKESYSIPDSVRVTQILIKFRDMITDEKKNELRQRAQEILGKIRNGADINLLVNEYSDAQESTSGGDLGYFKKGELIPEIDKVAFSIGIGESGLVETSSSIRIIKVTDRKTISYRSFDDTKTEIEEIIKTQKRDENYRTWMNDIRSHSYVEIRY